MQPIRFYFTKPCPCVISKVICYELCDEKMPWNAEVENCKRVREINSVKTELPRSIRLAQDSTTATDLHVLVDASTAVNYAAVYAVVHQPGKSQISKHNITISRFELISTHIGANLVQNVKSALESQNVRSVTG